MNPCRVYRDVPSGNSDQPPTQLLPPVAQPEDEPPAAQPEPPASFEYIESDDEGPEPQVPFDLPWNYEEEPASNQPTPAIRPPQPCDPAPQSPASRPPSPASQPPRPASQLTTPASQPPNPTSTSSHHEESTYTAKQLEAMKDFTLHVTDELGRNGFLRCIQALSKDAMENHEGFSKFKSLAASLKASFQKESLETPSREPLSLDDTLRVPRFTGKGKQKKKKLTPTMHYVLSGAEHREAIKLKEHGKQKEEKEKLARKTTREDKAREKREDLKKKR
ncbi:swi5-dependent recombination DNA repair protein 1 homolog [Aplysia californica]|uniref:Swi5-dependent recombination DNA repair protein 1 homolog n=1 Tax=Aplysia californica TaxID=6500 RepID=A0ABM1A9X6_APLCA|nr:swi5-dependent recombination DNA repair protein 1 homolog [Aplysia californica]